MLFSKKLNASGATPVMNINWKGTVPFLERLHTIAFHREKVYIEKCNGTKVSIKELLNAKTITMEKSLAQKLKK